jgi:transcription initiation factor IIE alpha subunit
MAEINTDELDSACEVLFGHTDWEFVDNKILRRHDDENYTVVLFHHEDTREEEEEQEVFKQAWCLTCKAIKISSKADYQSEFTCNTCGSEVATKSLYNGR